MNSRVYILLSPSKNKYYIGYTNTSSLERLRKHKEKYYVKAYTKSIDDWELYFEILCNSEKQAINIERHIKRMKSRKYIENLKKYPEMTEKLLIKYF